jgi:hypothetical protein
MSGARKKHSVARANPAPRPLTILDRDKYFDVTLSDEECEMIREKIMRESGFGRSFIRITKCFDLLRDAETEIMEALNMYPVPWGWQHIHVCKQLEIDYKSFARNIPKLPIEPFYAFVEPLFPHFRPAKNKMQLSIQTQHVHLAFIDWIDEACPKHGCQKEHHSFACWDRFETASYEEAARRICAHNARREKFTSSPLRIVHSRN